MDLCFRKLFSRKNFRNLDFSEMDLDFGKMFLESGEVNFYMLPFVKPSAVRRFYQDEEIITYTDAMKIAVDNMNIVYDGGLVTQKGENE